MALTDRDIEQIEHYLLDELTTEEKEKVEERIKDDPEFAEEVEFMRDVIIATREKGKEAFDSFFRETGQQEASEQERKTEKKNGSNKKKIMNMLKRWFKRLNNN